MRINFSAMKSLKLCGKTVFRPIKMFIWTISEFSKNHFWYKICCWPDSGEPQHHYLYSICSLNVQFIFIEAKRNSLLHIGLFWTFFQQTPIHWRFFYLCCASILIIDSKKSEMDPIFKKENFYFIEKFDMVPFWKKMVKKSVSRKLCKVDFIRINDM
jgi:hypothetical protein